MAVRMLRERARSARSADRPRPSTVPRRPFYELEQLFERMERQQLAARIEALFECQAVFQELQSSSSSDLECPAVETVAFAQRGRVEAAQRSAEYSALVFTDDESPRVAPGNLRSDPSGQA